MTTYYNINTQETRNRPTSRTTSNLWLNQEKLVEEGWREVITADDPVLSFGEEYGSGYSYVVGETTVTRTRKVSQIPLVTLKERLVLRAKLFVEGKMAINHGGISEQIGRRSGDFGAAARTAYLEDQTRFLGAFQTFKVSVNDASTLEELEVVYNDYPQLQ